MDIHTTRVENVVIGGGVIGLALAYQLSSLGRSVAVLQRSHLAGQSSWAGAGILTPAQKSTASHALEKLRARSNELHDEWAVRLRNKFSIDSGLRKCGGLYIARTPGDLAALRGQQLLWQGEEIEFESLDERRTIELQPQLAAANPQILRSLFVPGEWQIRNPWFLHALRTACAAQGVHFHEAEASSFRLNTQGDRLKSVSWNERRLAGETFCFAAGAWTQQIVAELGIRISSIPVRGQIVLYQLDQPPLAMIVSEGPRYLVPRDDGHLLVGSTVEEAGFDAATTEEAIGELKRFACSLLPQLAEKQEARSWAGLRPGSADGMPYLGRAHPWANVYVATGHFRTGLQLSTATAEVMAQLMLGMQPAIDLNPFRIGRG